MAIGRLLSYLGYDYQAAVRGRAEAVDTNALRRLLTPKQREQQAKPPAEATPPAEGVPTPAAMPAPAGAMPENP
jgi:hypothetical protein